MKKISLLIVGALFLLQYCGGSGGVTTSTGKQFIDDYEKFTQEYCSAADQFKGASLKKKMKLAQKLAKQGAEFQKYQNEIVKISSELSSADQKRLDEMSDRVSACAEKFKM